MGLEPLGGCGVGQAGAALGERAGFVDHQGVDLLHSFQGFSILDQNAQTRPATDPDHDRHRCGQTQRARAGDDQHGDSDDQRVREAGFRAHEGPHRKRQECHRDHGRYEHPGDPVSQALDRRAGTLCLGNHGHDARQHGVAAHLLGHHHQPTRLIDSAPDETVSRCLGHGHRLPRHQRFVHRRLALCDLTINRNPLSGADTQPVPELDVLQGDLFIASVIAQPPRGLRCHVQQRLDRARSLLPGTQF